MIIGYRSRFISIPDDDTLMRNGKIGSSRSDPIFQRPCRVRCIQSTASSMDGFEEAKERIRESFRRTELCPSSYDTAWVAMVPSTHSLNKPCFPECLDWILENQREDGSWGLYPTHPLLLKDSLSSTLACLLALTKWGLGHNQVQRGLGFIETYSWAVDTKDQISPQGFDIIFPSMIKYAEKLKLNLPLHPDFVNMAIHKRDSTIKRLLKGNVRKLEYMAEGVGELCDWKKIMLHQRQNGSLFDSPATTAAALIYHQHDEKCFRYLNSILQLHKNWVPTIYPTKIHSLLCLVDTLQCLGVHRYFETEIKDVLDETYRLWQQKNEEIFSNTTNCAMAFRLLLMSNYDVSSEELAEFVDEEHFLSTSGKYTSHVALVELHKASQLAIHEKDHILDKINKWTGIFMQQKLLNDDLLDVKSKKEVELALRKFYITYDRVENRRYIESYEENNFKMLKTAYRSASMNNVDLLTFAMKEFDLGLAKYKEELQLLKRWFKEYKLDQVGLGEEYIYRTHLIGVAVLFEPELSDARLVYTKYSFLLTLNDDLFEHLASKDELLNIIQLVQRWDEYTDVGFHSERVKLYFTALYNTVEEIAANAQIKQGRSVKHHLVALILEGMKNTLVDRVEWGTKDTTPSIEEYLRVAMSTFGLKCILLTAQYVAGIKLSQHLFESPEFDNLLNCSGTVMRLLNDLQSFKREGGSESRILNIVPLLVKQSSGRICEEEAIRQVEETIESNRRKLLRMVVEGGKGNQLPQALKDLFWRTAKAVYFFYSDHDELRSPKKVNHHINELMYKPLNPSLKTHNSYTPERGPLLPLGNDRHAD